MRPYLKVHRLSRFPWSKTKTGRLLSWHNHPGFLGFYGRIPLTRTWMLTAGLTSVD